MFVGGFVVSAGAQVGMQFLPEYLQLLQIVNVGALAAAFAGGIWILREWW